MLFSLTKSVSIYYQMKWNYSGLRQELKPTQALESLSDQVSLPTGWETNRQTAKLRDTELLH